MLVISIWILFFYAIGGTNFCSCSQFYPQGYINYETCMEKKMRYHGTGEAERDAVFLKKYSSFCFLKAEKELETYLKELKFHERIHGSKDNSENNFTDTHKIANKMRIEKPYHKNLNFLAYLKTKERKQKMKSTSKYLHTQSRRNYKTKIKFIGGTDSTMWRTLFHHSQNNNFEDDHNSRDYEGHRKKSTSGYKKALSEVRNTRTKLKKKLEWNSYNLDNDSENKILNLPIEFEDFYNMFQIQGISGSDAENKISLERYYIVGESWRNFPEHRVKRRPGAAPTPAAGGKPGGKSSAPPAGGKAGASPAPGGKPGASSPPKCKPGQTPKAGGKPGASPAPGGKPGESKKPGGKPGASPAPGGKPGASPAPGGKPGESKKPGGKPGASPAPGGKPGESKKPGGKPGASPAPGGKPGESKKPGGKPGASTPPGGKPGASPAPDCVPEESAGGKAGAPAGGKPGSSPHPAGMPQGGPPKGGKAGATTKKPPGG